MILIKEYNIKLQWTRGLRHEALVNKGLDENSASSILEHTAKDGNQYKTWIASQTALAMTG